MEIQRQITELTSEKWRFTFLDNVIYLDSYFLLEKESKRHKNVKVIKKYERINERDNTMTESDVIVTDELKEEVLKQFMSTIKVIKWSERRK